MFVAPGAWVSQVVLVETLWVLESVYDVDAGGRARAVEMLLEHRELTVQDPDVVERALGVEQPRLSDDLGGVLDVGAQDGGVRPAAAVSERAAT